MTDPLCRRRFGLWAAAILLVCLLLEGVVFQYDALATRALTPRALDLAAAAVVREEVAQPLSDVEAVMPSAAERAPTLRTTVTFTALDLRDIRTAAAELTGEKRLLRVVFSLSDDSHALGLTTADSVLTVPGQSARARLDVHGALRALQISFETSDETAALTALVLNAPVPYRFSPLRLAAFALPLLLLAAILCFGLWRVLLDRRNPRHHLAYALTALFCVLLIVGVQYLCMPEDRAQFQYTWDLRYPFEDEIYEYRAQAHAVLYDMLMHGRLAVDVTPDERLLALQNPYDPTQRLASGAEVMFDYALHDGQYYVYFGLTPVLVFYAPFCLLTGALPAYTTAACFFALLTVAGAFLCVWEAVRRFARRPALLSVCFGALAVALGGNLLMLQASADRYHLSIACMQAFFYLALWAGFVACRQKTRLRRTGMFMLCALFCVLLTGARATGALAAAGWLLPLFLCVLLSKKHGARRKLADALSFLIPLSVGAAALMCYNAARFGFALEFGQTWQLTLEDIRQNRLALRALPQAIYYYYLDALRLTPEFPFIAAGESFINHTGNWFYGVVNAGALSMPVTWGALLLFALPEKRRRGMLGILLTAVLFTLPVALAGYCLAGAALRYVCDILPTLCLAGALALILISGRDAQEGRGHTVAIACLLCAGTAIVACCLAFGNYRNFISLYSPQKYLYLHTLFSLL